MSLFGTIAHSPRMGAETTGQSQIVPSAQRRHTPRSLRLCESFLSLAEPLWRKSRRSAGPRRSLSSTGNRFHADLRALYGLMDRAKLRIEVDRCTGSRAQPDGRRSESAVGKVACGCKVPVRAGRLLRAADAGVFVAIRAARSVTIPVVNCETAWAWSSQGSPPPEVRTPTLHVGPDVQR